jgi:pimeloyl-ACP methyl ester carboxylesterase
VASFEWSDKEGRNIPREFIKRFYSETRNGGYKSIDVVGFSGGGAVAASTLAHHSDKKDASMVKSLIVINSPIAERGESGVPERDKFSCVPHTDAAYYAKNIRTRTLLIYADQEFLKEGVAEWKKRNQAEDWYYQGEHDFGKTPQSFDSVTEKVIDFLESSPDQEVRVASLARRKRAKRKRVRKSQGTQARQNIRKRGVLRLSHRKAG